MGDPQLLRDVLLVTPEEAAALLRVGRTTVYALMKGDELRPVHIGRSCRVSRAELERYVVGLTSSTPGHPAHPRQHGTGEDDAADSIHSRPSAH